jgi:hypothetical protein
MVELIAIDLDGTLLTSDKAITPRTLRAIRAVVGQGVKVIIASARPPRSVAKVYKHLRLDTCVICYNGALIYDPPAKEVLYHQPIERALAHEVIEAARKKYPDIFVSAEVLDHWFTDRISREYQTEVAKQFTPDHMGPIETWLTQDVTKIMFLGPPGHIRVIRRMLTSTYGMNLAMTQSETELLQVMSAEVSKGAALKFVCDRYGVPLQRTIAIGDQVNDIDMLKLAGVGIAMGLAPESVKRAADYITSGNDHDGVAEAIERFVL